ncbi:RHS repeat-associated core domain-containing protein [Streptomyces sp. AM 3-1-1]|uniref:RHS repeat-associated core domain-containing protein n=1 Tax=Streptomyces sp. AM 3-1-1 TaxID=3028711 RepID=UPI0023BA0DC1|nr:RHS repeat-associated core domain-containing protein [Streptomyces sp. AM 3-1-1]WEH30586.1 RHS repeat-associated core domain-containing protein [Streptomyces sp. AM 3-1-1]
MIVGHSLSCRRGQTTGRPSPAGEGLLLSPHPPDGQSRSEDSETIPGTRGFVGGTDDPTGLVHLGAREYDPTLGRFLSVDPVIDETDPAQMNAYSYAHNNPITQADPDGLRPDGPAGGATYNDDRWAADRGMTAGYTKKNGNRSLGRPEPRHQRPERTRACLQLILSGGSWSGDTSS